MTAIAVDLQAPPREWSKLFSNRRAMASSFLIALSASFLLGGYEFIRSSSNTLFITAYGKKAMPVVMAIMPIGVIICLYAYGRILSRLGARKTLLVTSIGSGAIIGLCYLLIENGVKEATAITYIFREAYIMLIIEQYWSYLVSTLDDQEARAINGPICGICSLGGITGGVLVAHLAERLGTNAMLLFAAVSCIPAALASDFAYRINPKVKGERKEQEAPGQTPKKKDYLGLAFFRQHHILKILLGLVLTTQVLSTVTNLSFQGILHEAIPIADKQTAFSGAFFAWLNTGAAFFQFIVAPLVLRNSGLIVVHIMMPLVQVATCLYLLLVPNLISAGIAYMTFKILDYSLFGASKGILYIPLPFDARFRAKEVIDVLGYRIGKGGTSLSITLLQQGGLVFTDAIYASIGLAATVVWLGLVAPASRYFKGKT